MSALLSITAATIMIARGRMANQLRLDNPMSERDAWTLLHDSHSLDWRRLAAHRLLDLAIAAKNSLMIDQIVTWLEPSEVLCDGLLHRIKQQPIHQGWQKWARQQLRSALAA